jgi:hypothetical protein
MDTNALKIPAVYAAIAAVMADLSREGITKDRKNAQQGFAFRGIDDVLNTLNPILSRHRLLMLPRVLSRSCEERATKSGGALFYTTVHAEFDLVAAEDGSKHTVATYGEAMDSGDKSTNKAMSAAYKYAAFQAFCIPTEGDNDADSITHEPAARTTAKASAAPAGKPVESIVTMATVAQKMEIAQFHLDPRTKDGVQKSLEFYQEKEGVDVKTMNGLTAKAATIILKKCTDAIAAADAAAKGGNN